MIMPWMTYTLWPHDLYFGAMPSSLVNTLALLDETKLSRILLRPYQQPGLLSSIDEGKNETEFWHVIVRHMCITASVLPSS